MTIQQYQQQSRSSQPQLYDPGALPVPPRPTGIQRPQITPAMQPAMPQQPGRPGYQLPRMPGQFLQQGRGGGGNPQFQPWSGGYQMPWMQQQRRRGRAYAAGIPGQPFDLRSGMGGGYGGGYQMPQMDSIALY